MTNAIVLAAAVLLGASPSQKERSIEGAWEGNLKALGGDLKLIFHVTKAADGTLSAKADSPDQGAFGMKVDSISNEPGSVALEMKRIRGRFQGKLSDSGDAIAGEWTQITPMPLTLKKVDPAKVEPPNVPKALEGLWEGALKARGGIELRLVLRVKTIEDGTLTLALDSPDQGASGIPINTIALNKGELTFSVKAVGGKYAGTMNDDQTEVKGKWSQAGTSMPLDLKKVEKVKEANRPQTPKPPFPYKSEDVAYENKAGGVKLAGTLTVPQGSGPFPAVVLITGSGAQDRDETILGHKPFLVLADALTRRGILVLRVDDRGVGGSTGSTARSTSEDFARDVIAGVNFLKQRRDVDPKKIGLIGHSEGGIIAPIAATRSKDVAFIILMAGTGLPGREILVMQGQLILKASGVSESDLSSFRELQGRLVEIATAAKDDKDAETQMLAALKAAQDALPEKERKSAEETGGLGSAALPQLRQIRTPWFRFFLTFDPRPTLAKVQCPMLALGGEKDLQVPPKENLGEIAKAVRSGRNTNVTTREFPGLNHLFQTCKTGAPSEYARIEETIAPEVLKTIGDWIVQQTGGK